MRLPVTEMELHRQVVYSSHMTKGFLHLLSTDFGQIWGGKCMLNCSWNVKLEFFPEFL